MVCQHEAIKLMQKKDWLIELPEDVVSVIISMLTLKEAVKTSILSRSWRFKWTDHPNLLFDSVNIFGSRVSKSISSCHSEAERHIITYLFKARINHLMYQRCKGPKIDSLTLHFQLGRESSYDISQWISCAIDKGVETIDLDLSDFCGLKLDRPAYEQYSFPCSLLDASGTNCTPKHLRLTSCNLSCLPNHDSLISLVTVELHCVSIIDRQLEHFLSSSPLLEKLSLNLCNDLVNFSVAGANTHMKLLSIKNCFRLEKIHLNAENLFVFEYTGQPVIFCFKKVPRLTDLFFSFTGMSRMDGVTYALTKLAYDLPQLMTLNLLSTQAINNIKLPEEVPTFTNVMQLVLTVFPFHDEDKLYWIRYVLKAFPLLQKLQLNLFTPSFIKQRKEIERNLPECVHRHLKELEINGYYGNRHEVELLKYLVNNTVGLEVVEINQRQKAYNGFNNWGYKAASSWYKLRKETFAWLDKILPTTTNLKLCQC